MECFVACFFIRLLEIFYLLFDGFIFFCSKITVEVISVILTFLVVIVALFQEKIKKWFHKSILDMEINLTPPDCHQIDLVDGDGNFVCKSLYIRLKISHKKGVAAENVEIMPISFSSISLDGEVKKLGYFLPINLTWSHFQPRTNVMRVPVGLFRHCDFGHFISDESHGSGSILVLDTIVMPNIVANGERPNVIKPGKYIFELLLSGDNVAPIAKKWKLEFGDWHNDEKLMLDSITIEEI